MNNIYKIQLNSPQALILLQQLEKFDIIKLLTKESTTKRKSSFEKFRGLLTSDEAEKMQNEITKGRDNLL